MNSAAQAERQRARAAFTLIEVLVAAAVLALMLTLVAVIVGRVAEISRASASRVETFQGARAAFEQIALCLGRATLNPSVEYGPADSAAGRPAGYARRSDLKFLVTQSGAPNVPGTPDTGQAVFFCAPLAYARDEAVCGGVADVLNVCGFYVEFADRAPPLAEWFGARGRPRYRLMQLLAPAEHNTVYDRAAPADGWFSRQPACAAALADNIIALVVRVRDRQQPEPGRAYAYNSTPASETAWPQPVTAHRLPPAADLTLVAIDERSALRLSASGDAPPAALAEALAGRFTDSERYEDDLAELKNQLTAAGIRWRVFAGAVPLREAW